MTSQGDALPLQYIEGWAALRGRLQDMWPDMDKDVMMRDDAEVSRQLLLRFLHAEDGKVDKALARLEKTAHFRMRYAIGEMYRPNMARRLFTTKGAEMYFCNSAGLRDRHGCQYLVGRLMLCGEIHPKNHMRAAMLVIERASLDLQKNKAPGINYILDLQPVTEKGTVSGTGGGKNLASTTHHKPEKAKDGIDKDWDILAWHDCVGAGFPTLKEALRMLERHYPETLRRVFFYNAPFWFYAIFKVFSLWVPRSKDKFVFVSKGKEQAIFSEIEPSQLFPEFGGCAARSLGNDDFIAEAIKAYDEDADTHMSPTELGGDWEADLPACAQ